MVEQVVNTGYTRRDDCRLHHIGVGRRHAGKTIAMLVLPDQDLLPDHLPGQRQFEGCKDSKLDLEMSVGTWMTRSAH